MRKIFIADAHLKNAGDANYLKLMEFLEGLKGNTETLFIMGDLFEFWIGYEKNPFTHYDPVLKRLLELSESGVRIVYFEGNHDFHLGPFFEKRLGAEVHPGPAVLELEGKMVYLCHGDQINRKEWGARFLRAVLHNRLTKTIRHIVPPAAAVRIAQYLGKKSKRNHSRNNRKWDYRGMLREFAAERFGEGRHMVVVGHFHTPFMETREDGRTILSLGDWISQYSYGEWENGKISLKTYP